MDFTGYVKIVFMFKEFFIRKIMKKQLAGMPESEQEKIIQVVSDNPEFFQKIALEIKARMDKGEDQMAATQAVMQNYRTELQGMMKK